MIRNRQKSIISQRVHAIMHVLFGIFLFLYFYFLQSPLLELAQHQLSGGKTQYSPLASALILTCILILVQRLVSKWIYFSEVLYSFSYLPSVVLAVMLTAFTPKISIPVLIFSGSALIGFGLAVFFSSRTSANVSHENQSFSQLLAVHAVGMVGVLLSLGIFSNTSDITTYEIQAARHIRNMDYKQALHIGSNSLNTTSRLTALRAFALERSGRGMANYLFTYALSQTGAEQLLLASGDTLKQILSPDSIYVNLGVWRSNRESALHFFERAVRRNDTIMTDDYWLTALLLEKQLSKFVKELPHYVAVNDSTELPRHYAEALVLYAADGGKLPLFMGDSLMKMCYAEYMELSMEFSDSLVRKNKLCRQFGDTYWWYYHYQH